MYSLEQWEQSEQLAVIGTSFARATGNDQWRRTLVNGRANGSHHSQQLSQKQQQQCVYLVCSWCEWLASEFSQDQYPLEGAPDDGDWRLESAGGLSQAAVMTVTTRLLRPDC